MSEESSKVLSTIKIREVECIVVFTDKSEDGDNQGCKNYAFIYYA